MRKVVTRGVVSLLIGLAMQFPYGHGYAPVARILWALLTEPRGHWGHGPRWYWTAVTLVILLIYTCAAFLLLSSVRWFLKMTWPRR